MLPCLWVDQRMCSPFPQFPLPKAWSLGQTTACIRTALEDATHPSDLELMHKLVSQGRLD